MREHRSFIVIPAKAGIHLAATAKAAGWIPAFAGMTKRDAGMTVRDAGMTRSQDDEEGESAWRCARIKTMYCQTIELYP
jgi:hypothetical protein